jgi:hypothetical protein
MKIERIISEQTIMICILSLLIGIILLMGSYFLSPGILYHLTVELGLLCTSICIVSFLYEKFIAEKHFEKFRGQMKNVLKEQTLILTSCNKLGITHIFGTRNEYEEKYPIESLLGKVRKNGRILVVGRTMFHFFNKLEAIKTALHRGANLQVAMIGSSNVDRILRKIAYLRIDQLASPLSQIIDQLKELLSEKPLGTLEVKIYMQPLPDSFVFIEEEESELIVWDLNFGLDLADKVIFLMNPQDTNLGKKLLKRYDLIWKFSETILKTEPGGIVTINKMASILLKIWPTKPSSSSITPAITELK